MTAMGAAQAQPAISIRVVEGDNAINSIRMKRGHDPVVQVLNATGEPLAGATVSFLLPPTGAGATFSDGASVSRCRPMRAAMPWDAG